MRWYQSEDISLFTSRTTNALSDSMERKRSDAALRVEAASSPRASKPRVMAWQHPVTNRRKGPFQVSGRKQNRPPAQSPHLVCTVQHVVDVGGNSDDQANDVEDDIPPGLGVPWD